MNVEDSRPVVWIRDLFEHATTESMFRWMIVAWLVLIGAMVLFDRLGSGLLGRSKPLVQVPPDRARAWRWGRSQPPVEFSPLPSGTVVSNGTQNRARSIPLARPLTIGPGPVEEVEIDLFDADLDDDEFWHLIATDGKPMYGAENDKLLDLARAPERFNPVHGRVEQLGRNRESARCHWPADVNVERISVGEFAVFDQADEDLDEAEG